MEDIIKTFTRNHLINRDKVQCLRECNNNSNLINSSSSNSNKLISNSNLSNSSRNNDSHKTVLGIDRNVTLVCVNDQPLQKVQDNKLTLRNMDNIANMDNTANMDNMGNIVNMLNTGNIINMGNMDNIANTINTVSMDIFHRKLEIREVF